MADTKRSQRPRIDSIVKHIVAGSYDDEIDKIQSAISRRNQYRQEAVLKLVKQVFGKQAIVDADPGDPPNTGMVGKPAARRTRPGAPKAPAPDTPPVQELPPELAEAEAAALRREAELEAELAASTGVTSAEPDDDEAGIVSNSPQIGAVE